MLAGSLDIDAADKAARFIRFCGAYVAMNSKGLGADFVYAWSAAEIDVMGKSIADEIVHPALRVVETEPSVLKAAQGRADR